MTVYLKTIHFINHVKEFVKLEYKNDTIDVYEIANNTSFNFKFAITHKDNCFNFKINRFNIHQDSSVHSLLQTIKEKLDCYFDKEKVIEYRIKKINKLMNDE